MINFRKILEEYIMALRDTSKVSEQFNLKDLIKYLEKHRPELFEDEE
uniref:Uncharacterized protein n=1 Tax=viral metagenome TaxID=1070528 RepID=A0A6M3LPE9_9ZZZZ